MIVPLAFATAVPCGGSLTPEMDRPQLSMSVSLASTEIVTGTPWAVVAESLTATGGSLTAPIVTWRGRPGRCRHARQRSVYWNDPLPLALAVGTKCTVPLALTVAVPLTGRRSRR